jgi:hypothetical protein
MAEPASDGAHAQNVVVKDVKFNGQMRLPMGQDDVHIANVHIENVHIAHLHVSSSTTSREPAFQNAVWEPLLQHDVARARDDSTFQFSFQELLKFAGAL